MSKHGPSDIKKSELSPNAVTGKMPYFERRIDIRDSVLNPSARIFVPSCVALATRDKSIADASHEDCHRIPFNIELFEDLTILQDGESPLFYCGQGGTFASPGFNEIFDRQERALRLLEDMRKEDLTYMMQKYIAAGQETPLARACCRPTSGNYYWITQFAEKMGFDFFYNRNPVSSAWELLETRNKELYAKLKEMEAEFKKREAKAKSKMLP